MPSNQEWLVLERAEARAVAALELLLEYGISHTMNLINHSSTMQRVLGQGEC
jgi:hypothetical protein